MNWYHLKSLAPMFSFPASSQNFGRASVDPTPRRTGKPSKEKALNHPKERRMNVPGNISRGCMKDTSSSETWMRFCARNAANGPVLRMMPLSAKIAKRFGVIAVLIGDHAKNLFHAKNAQTFPRLIVGNASQLARSSPVSARALTVGIIAAVGILSNARSATLPYARAACRFTIMIVRILRRREMLSNFEPQPHLVQFK